MNRRLFLGGVLASWVLAPRVSRATVYFTADDIKTAMFPTATRFVDRSLMLTRAQMKAIAKASKTRVKFPRVRAFEAYDADGQLGTLFVDKVIGKHEFITFALALNSDGVVSGVEVMEYRESYGGQVRNASWRQQFFGRRFGQPLRINKDIKNISGATLSCSHLTDGVRRLLTTHALNYA